MEAESCPDKPRLVLEWLKPLYCTYVHVYGGTVLISQGLYWSGLNLSIVHMYMCMEAQS